MEGCDATPKIQVHQTERKQETRRESKKPEQLKKTLKVAKGRSISRCTRSQVAPKWTKKETMILLNEIACQDYELAKILPSNQRWKIVAEGCAKMKISRSSNDCKRQWDSLLNERNKIHAWENSKSFSKLGSYWSLESSMRKDFQLMASFDEDVFGAIEGVMEVQEALSGSKELVQVSDEAEKDDASYDTDASDDKVASDDTDASDASTNNDDGDVNDESDDCDYNDNSDDDSEQTTTETESSDLNVPIVRTRAINGRRKKVAAIFDTKAINTSPEAEAEAEPEPDADNEVVAEAEPDADNEVVADAEADAEAGASANASADPDAGAIKGWGKKVARIFDTELTDASTETGASANARVEAEAGADADKDAVLDADKDAGAIKGWGKKVARIFDTELTDASTETGASANAGAKAEAGADADKDAVLDANANAGAIKGWGKNVARIFDTELTDASTETGASANAGAEAGAGADAVLDANANANAGAIKGWGKKVARIFDTELADANTETGASANAGAEAGADADKDALLDANANAGKKEIETTKVYRKEQEMANKLRENAKQIHAIIKGESEILPDNVHKIQIDLTKPNVTESEIIERQAGELIKSFEVLVSSLDQFSNLIKEGSCEGINFIKPMGP